LYNFFCSAGFPAPLERPKGAAILLGIAKFSAVLLGIAKFSAVLLGTAKFPALLKLPKGAEHGIFLAR
jgi:hypothetical protein